MGFLIKTAFWLSLVIVFLPAPQNEGAKTAQMIGTTEAVSLLTAALNDARGFCSRNPDACVTGAAAAQTFGYKAQYATQLLHDLIADKLDDAAAASPPAKQESLKKSAERSADAGADTLSPADLQPAWRSPETVAARFKRS